MGKKNEKISQDYNSSCCNDYNSHCMLYIMQSGKRLLLWNNLKKKQKEKWIQNKLDIQNDITKKKKLPMQNLP